MNKKSQTKSIKLSQSQLDVMQVLWQQGKCSVSQVHEILMQQKSLAITTVGTVLKRLLDKEIVTYEKQGRQYLYCAQVSEDEVQASMLGNMLTGLFNGRPDALVHHLVDQNDVSDEDIEKIKAILNGSQEQPNE